METPPFDFAVAAYPLAPATLYNVGGPARLALLPRNEDECRAAYAWMLRQPERKLILGGGSNVLIADEGFPGVVLFTTGLKRLDDLGDHRYSIGSGHDLDFVVREIMLANNYDGVGALTGIPGSVGGAIYMNAGTVNGSTCQFMESVDILGPEGLAVIPMTPERYTYRGQNFCAPGDVILGGLFRFTVSDQDQRAIYDHYIARRLEKQPRGYCCGSVFKNPPGDHAGRLIEACGLKGARRGGAVISPMHANFIMNENNAGFDDIVGLIQLARSRVREQFGVELEPEVRIIR
ncbi:MAG TPA: UDP-N-acetylmuramate dehydrogenase [Candidatus Hydrogenedentes bacterium]|nr:UDP-N-acetylmuramate dehydrogenase [Candidatus Hydrogenedentota bacterium]